LGDRRRRIGAKRNGDERQEPQAKGRRLRKEGIDPIIADLRRLTGWSEATVVDRLKLNKKKY
jgi:hypothetical protein